MKRTISIRTLIKVDPEIKALCGVCPHASIFDRCCLFHAHLKVCGESGTPFEYLVKTGLLKKYQQRCIDCAAVTDKTAEVTVPIEIETDGKHCSQYCKFKENAAFPTCHAFNAKLFDDRSIPQFKFIRCKACMNSTEEE